MTELLTEEERKKVSDYIVSELKRATEERSDLEEKWDKWRRQREGQPEHKTKNWPWDKASNLCVPLAMIRNNSIYASFKSSFNQKKPFYFIGSSIERSRKYAQALMRYLDILVESKFHLHLRKHNNDIFDNVTCLGTAFVTVPWVDKKRIYKRVNSDGSMETVERIIKNGPSVYPLKNENFFARSYVDDLQEATWIGMRSFMTLHELEEREEMGIFSNVDKIKMEIVNLPDNTERSLERTGVHANDVDLYEIYECYLYWKLEGDKFRSDIKIFIEPKTGTIVREELNSLGFRPIVRIPYISRPNQLYGMGVGWIVEYLQDEVDTLHNMGIDGSLLAALRMLIVRRGCGLGDREKLYPAKILMTDDPRSDINHLEFPDIGPSTIQREAIVQQYADQATGSTDALRGMPDTYAKTRATASGTMFLAQQGSRLAEAINENASEAYNEIGLFVVLQMIRHKEQVNLSLVSEADADLIREVLNMDENQIHLNFTFKVQTSDVEQTDSARRQAFLTLSQLYSLYGQQMLGLMQSGLQTVSNPNIMGSPLGQKYMEFLNQFAVGGTKLMGRILDHFDLEHDGYLPYIKDIEMMLETIKATKERQAGGIVGENEGRNSENIQS